MDRRNVNKNYNYAGRMTDHRQCYDFNYAINQPVLSRVWLMARKKKFLGGLMDNFGMYYCAAAFIFSISTIIICVIRDENRPRHYKGVLSNPILGHGKMYLHNNRRDSLNLGNWNHNFHCWENTPNCGRDLDLDNDFMKKLKRI